MDEMEKLLGVYKDKLESCCAAEMATVEGSAFSDGDIAELHAEELTARTALLAYHQRRVEELEREVDLQRQMVAATKHSVIATIGGVDYEGNPTSTINYLQRLRILVEAEQERDRYKAEVERLREAALRAWPLVCVATCGVVHSDACKEIGGVLETQAQRGD